MPKQMTSAESTGPLCKARGRWDHEFRNGRQIGHPHTVDEQDFVGLRIGGDYGRDMVAGGFQCDVRTSRRSSENREIEPESRMSSAIVPSTAAIRRRGG